MARSIDTKTRNREYYQANKERLLAAAKEYAARNTEIVKLRQAEYRERNKDALREKNRQWRERNKDWIREYRASNKEMIAERRRSWWLSNTDRVEEWKRVNAEKVRGYGVKWSNANKDKVNAKTGRRNAQRVRATPSWAENFVIAEMYHLAQLRTRATGFGWHVDHIVPLRSPLVCGLHCEFNMQVIPGRENITKNNKYWPDMPC